MKKEYSVNETIARNYYSLAVRRYSSMLADCREQTKLIRQSPVDIQAFYAKQGVVPAVKYLPRHAQDLLDFLVKKGKKAVETHFNLEDERTLAINEKRETPWRRRTPPFVSLYTFDKTELDYLIEDPFGDE